jgi:hypothetical protein
MGEEPGDEEGFTFWKVFDKILRRAKIEIIGIDSSLPAQEWFPPSFRLSSRIF